jgi:quinol monooxygenase YgiN
MITEYIRYELKTSAPEALIAAYTAAGEYLKAAPECLGYDLAHCEEDEASFILRIRWTSTRDHIEVFRKGPNFPPFLALIRPFIGEIAEMRHYAETGVAWRRS